MKLSFNWLKQYVEIPVSPEELADVLPQLGFEVEELIQVGVPPLQHVCVGEILTRELHPNADRLTVCSVNVGQEAPLSIVCGAKNHAVGHRVFVALSGAILPGNFKIKKGKIRGIPSEGMMCSASELGLSEESNGLYILKEDIAIGTPVNDVLRDYDVVYDLSITANRSDALSHMGLARDLAAYFNKPFQRPELPDYPLVSSAKGLLESLRVESLLCPYYMAYGLKNIHVKESPLEIKKALESLGLRSVNNVVDIANWVMLETGQPLHVFDAKKIEQKSLVIRCAKLGEKIQTLDGNTYDLPSTALLVADPQKPLAIAGIMGAQSAQVDETTIDIVIEAAYFNPTSIRQTARHLGLSTDSSYRFERGIDPAGVSYALIRALQLIQEHAGGVHEPEGWEQGNKPFGSHTIHLIPQQIRDILGFGPEDAKIRSIFERLGFSVLIQGDAWLVKIPSARAEVAAVEDLAEEFLRIYGTAHIPAERPLIKATSREDEGKSRFIQKVSERLVGANFSECMHYSLQSEKVLRATGISSEKDLNLLKVLNPLSIDQAYLRPSLLPGLLEAIQLNLSSGNDVRRLFEIGHVFVPEEGVVQEALSIAFTELEATDEKSWKVSKKPDFFEVRERISTLLSYLGLQEGLADWKKIMASVLWQEGHSASLEIMHKQQRIFGRAGLLNFGALKHWGLDSFLWAGELVVPLGYFQAAYRWPLYQSFSAYPSVRKDLALLVDKYLPVALVIDEIESAAKASIQDTYFIERVDLFDLYEGEAIVDSKKSVAFALSFRSMDRTLTDQEVNQSLAKIQEILHKKGYLLRS